MITDQMLIFCLSYFITTVFILFHSLIISNNPLFYTEKLRHQTKLELEDSKSSSHQQSRQCLSMKSMPDLLSGSSGNFFRNNSGGPGANSGNGSCAGKSPSPPPDSLEDISYIDMEDDEMEEVIFLPSFFDRELLERSVYSIFANYG